MDESTASQLLSAVAGSEDKAAELIQAAEIANSSVDTAGLDVDGIFKFLSGDFSLADVGKIFSSIQIDPNQIKDALTNNPLLKTLLASYLEEHPELARVAKSDITNVKMTDMLAVLKSAPNILNEAREKLNAACDLVGEFIG